MLTDIWTVCLRKWQELLYQRNKIWKTLLNELFSLATFGIFSPLPLGNSGEDTSAILMSLYLVPSTIRKLRNRCKRRFLNIKLSCV